MCWFFGKKHKKYHEESIEINNETISEQIDRFIKTELPGESINEFYFRIKTFASFANINNPNFVIGLCMMANSGGEYPKEVYDIYKLNKIIKQYIENTKESSLITDSSSGKIDCVKTDLCNTIVSTSTALILFGCKLFSDEEHIINEKDGKEN